MTEPSSTLLNYEDFPVGEVAEFGAYKVTREEILEFATEYDPLPFHTDEEAALASMAGGLIASGWHVCSMQMRMIYDGLLYNAASMGSFGLESVSWKKPVRPGDVLSCRRTTLSKRVSKSKPAMGIIEVRWEIFNQDGELKSITEGSQLMVVRNPVQGAAQ